MIVNKVFGNLRNIINFKKWQFDNITLKIIKVRIFKKKILLFSDYSTYQVSVKLWLTDKRLESSDLRINYIQPLCLKVKAKISALCSKESIYFIIKVFVIELIIIPNFLIKMYTIPCTTIPNFVNCILTPSN